MGGGPCLCVMSQWSAREIHLPQLLNEEASADEFSRWEQVSSVAAERFAHLKPTPDPPGPLPISLVFIDRRGVEGYYIPYLSMMFIRLGLTGGR